MHKSTLRAGAAMALAMFAASPLVAAKLKLPPPTAPKDQIHSPGAVARDLEKRGYRIEKMKRKGTTYSITATGPNGNKVQMTVDGRSRAIVGLAVLQAAANLAGAIAAIVKSGKRGRYIDDRYPFGILVPDTYQTRWTTLSSQSWTSYSTEYVTESWSASGYRFAVPYNTVRPGASGYSVTTLRASELSDPVYDVYDYDGSQVSTEYSEESVEISEASSFQAEHSAELEAMEDSYLGGQVGDEDFELAEVEDLDSSDIVEAGEEEADNGAAAGDEGGSIGVENDAGDEAGVDDEAGADEPDNDIGYEDNSDEVGDYDDGGDDGDYDDGGDDGGDDGDDDSEPEAQADNFSR